MTNLINLMRQGLLQAGQYLIFEQKRKNVVHKAEVLANGMLKTADGVVHKTPSGAAKHLNGNKPIDGWNAWKTENNLERLSKLRQRL